MACETAGGLTLKFGAKGVVKVTGKLADGTKVSATARALPLAWHSTMTPNLLVQVCVYVPKTGFCRTYGVLLTVGADGKFDTASSAAAVPSDLHAPVDVQTGKIPLDL